MTTMKVKVFNTTGYVFVTASGGVIGAYEMANVNDSDKAVAKGIASGELVPQDKPAPVPAPAPAVTAEDAPTDPQPEADTRRRSRNRNTEPEA